MNTQPTSGFLLIDKPPNVSSFYCVKHVRKLLPRATKVGHAGTLDVFATGLLIIAFGRQATKQLTLLLDTDKTYSVTAKLGELTDTLDYTGTILKQHAVDAIITNHVEHVFTTMPSTYEQIPPIYSALKHNGQPLYKLARNKQCSVDTLEKITITKKRIVHIHSLQLTSISFPFFSFTAHVSKGTYIRSLAHDLATHIDSLATTYELRRTAIGNFSVKHAVSIETLSSYKDCLQHSISLEEFTQKITALRYLHVIF